MLFHPDQSSLNDHTADSFLSNYAQALLLCNLKGNRY